MSKYELKLKEVEMLIQRENINPQRKSEELLEKYYAKRKQLLNLIKPEEDATK
jgi:hypothetical protein